MRRTEFLYGTGHGTKTVENIQRAGSSPLSVWKLQWGHGTRPWRTARGLHPMKKAKKASMGPRHEDRGEQVARARCSKREHWLQWGHGTKTVENLGRTRASNGVAAASMGPRHEDRGELPPPALRAGGGPLLSFNGATARDRGGPGKPVVATSGHARFNGATARRPWRTPLPADSVWS